MIHSRALGHTFPALNQPSSVLSDTDFQTESPQTSAFPSLIPSDHPRALNTPEPSKALPDIECPKSLVSNLPVSSQDSEEEVQLVEFPDYSAQGTPDVQDEDDTITTFLSTPEEEDQLLAAKDFESTLAHINNQETLSPEPFLNEVQVEPQDRYSETNDATSHPLERHFETELQSLLRGRGAPCHETFEPLKWTKDVRRFDPEARGRVLSKVMSPSITEEVYLKLQSIKTQVCKNAGLDRVCYLDDREITIRDFFDKLSEHVAGVKLPNGYQPQTSALSRGLVRPTSAAITDVNAGHSSHLEGPLAQPLVLEHLTATDTWEELSVGMRWIIIRIAMNLPCAFSVACTHILGLDRAKVLQFLHVFLGCQLKWKKWAEDVSKRLGAASKQCVASGLGYEEWVAASRPRLPTDLVQDEDFTLGIRFLQKRCRVDLAEELSRWQQDWRTLSQGQSEFENRRRMGFIRLEIDRDVRRDVCHDRKGRNRVEVISKIREQERMFGPLPSPKLFVHKHESQLTEREQDALTKQHYAISDRFRSGYVPGAFVATWEPEEPTYPWLYNPLLTPSLPPLDAAKAAGGTQVSTATLFQRTMKGAKAADQTASSGHRMMNDARVGLAPSVEQAPGLVKHATAGRPRVVHLPMKGSAKAGTTLPSCAGRKAAARTNLLQAAATNTGGTNATQFDTSHKAQIPGRQPGIKELGRLVEKHKTGPAKSSSLKRKRLEQTESDDSPGGEKDAGAQSDNDDDWTPAKNTRLSSSTVRRGSLATRRGVGRPRANNSGEASRPPSLRSGKQTDKQGRKAHVAPSAKKRQVHFDMDPPASPAKSTRRKPKLSLQPVEFGSDIGDEDSPRGPKRRRRPSDTPVSDQIASGLLTPDSSGFPTPIHSDYPDIDEPASPTPTRRRRITITVPPKKKTDAAEDDKVIDTSRYTNAPTANAEFAFSATKANYAINATSALFAEDAPPKNVKVDVEHIVEQSSRDGFRTKPKEDGSGSTIELLEGMSIAKHARMLRSADAEWRSLQVQGAKGSIPFAADTAMFAEYADHAYYALRAERASFSYPVPDEQLADEES